MIRNIITKLTFLIILFYSFNDIYANQKPLIIATINPFHLIVKEIAGDKVESRYLVAKSVSPHDYILKPSDVIDIKSASLIIWAGPGLEGSFEKLLSQYPEKVIQLDKLNIKSYLIRTSEIWEKDSCGHNHSHTHDSETSHDHHKADKKFEENNIDPHFWLSLDNSIVIIDEITNKLIEILPKAKDEFIQKSNALKSRIFNVKEIINLKLNDLSDVPYIVLHDAILYFEKDYSLNPKGSIILNPQIPPSLKRVSEVQAIIKKNDVKCIVYEPEFNKKILDNIIYKTDIKVQKIDPLGIYLNDDDNYEKLFLNLAKDLRECLKK